MTQEEIERHEFVIEKLTMNQDSTLNACGLCERKMNGFYVVVDIFVKSTMPRQAESRTLSHLYTPAPKGLFSAYFKMKRKRIGQVKVTPHSGLKTSPAIIRTSLPKEICFFCALSLIEKGKAKDKDGFYKKELTDWIECNKVRLTLEEL